MPTSLKRIDLDSQPDGAIEQGSFRFSWSHESTPVPNAIIRSALLYQVSAAEAMLSVLLMIEVSESRFDNASDLLERVCNAIPFPGICELCPHSLLTIIDDLLPFPVTRDGFEVSAIAARLNSNGTITELQAGPTASVWVGRLGKPWAAWRPPSSPFLGSMRGTIHPPTSLNIANHVALFMSDSARTAGADLSKTLFAAGPFSGLLRKFSPSVTKSTSPVAIANKINTYESDAIARQNRTVFTIEHFSRTAEKSAPLASS